MPKADLSVEFPPLPEGWQGTPDQLLEHLVNTAIFSFDGDFPTGQVGGSKPTQDVGIWYSDDSIEKFVDGEYVPISDVPVGVVFAWASTAATIPANYLLCDGSSLIRADYARLFAVIGTTYGNESATTFNLPDFRGRAPVGAGVGDYKKQGLTGRMAELTAGDYIGYEWLNRASIGASQPKKSMKDTPGNKALEQAKNRYLSVQPPAIAMNFIIRYR